MLLLLLIVLLIIAVIIGLASSFIDLLIFLIVAAIVGWLAKLIVPGHLPFGWLGAVIAGLVGSWIGALVLGNFGPSLAGIYLIPAFVGAVIFVAVVSLLAYIFSGLGRARY